MAKSARASAIKKNKQGLKSRVFGPAEAQRNERLSAKLLELASQPNPPRQEMDVEQDGSKDMAESEAKAQDTADDEDMDVEGEAAAKARRPTSITAQKKQKAAKSARIDKKKHRKPRNSMTFATYHSKRSKKGGKR